MTSLVVVGASLAGLRACEAARRAGWTGRLVLVGAEEHLPYDRPPLSKAVLAAGPPPAATTYRCADELLELGVELRLGAPATGLDPGARQVHVGDAVLSYDAVVLATGAHARELPRALGPGARLPGVHALRTWQDALAIRAALDAGARTVVVGAGFVGTEVASAAVARGLPVTVVEAAAQPLLRAVGEQVAPRVADLHRRAGVDLRCATRVSAIEGDGRVERVGLDDGSVLAADLVVVGTGATPTSGWLDGSGLTLQDGVVCDDGLQAAPGVWAAGDVARFPLQGASVRLEHWTGAAEQGAHAGRAAAGAPGPFTTVPYAWSDVHGRKLQVVGLTGGEDVEVHGDDDRWVALYRRGDRLAGAFTVDLPGRAMKYRRLVATGGSWADALALTPGAAPAPGVPA